MTNNLMNINTLTNTLTMSSLEIAELTGKEHFHVLRDIRVMLDELHKDNTASNSGCSSESKFGLSSNFEGSYKDSTGRTLPCYHLDKDHTICLISGYETSIRMRIIKRWQELESKQSTPSNQMQLPKTYIEALEALVASEKAKQIALKESEELKIQLDQATLWASVKRVESKLGHRFNWHSLKEWHKANNISIKKVFDQNYGSINAYCGEAWKMVYGVDISKLQ